MLVIGHRGASVAAAENTVQAFVLADAMGADGVELDVRLAPDGRLLVKHDPLPIDADRLAEYPDLSTVLAACGDMLVNVEIKNSVGERGHDPTLAVVESTIAEMRLHGSIDRWVLSSFDWATLQRCREVAPDLATAFLVEKVADGVAERVAAAGHIALHPDNTTLTEHLVEQCHTVGLAVNTWTCNEPDRIRQLALWGVDGVCTDVPDVALGSLGRRVGPATPRWGRPA